MSGSIKPWTQSLRSSLGSEDAAGQRAETRRRHQPPKQRSRACRGALTRFPSKGIATAVLSWLGPGTGKGTEDGDRCDADETDFMLRSFTVFACGHRILVRQLRNRASGSVPVASCDALAALCFSPASFQSTRTAPTPHQYASTSTLQTTSDYAQAAPWSRHKIPLIRTCFSTVTFPVPSPSSKPPVKPSVPSPSSEPAYPRRQAALAAVNPLFAPRSEPKLPPSGTPYRRYDEVKRSASAAR